MLGYSLLIIAACLPATWAVAAWWKYRSPLDLTIGVIWLSVATIILSLASL